MKRTKLYVKTQCLPCRGKGGLWCNYCDIDGNVYVEASDKTVIRFIKEMDEERKADMLKEAQSDEGQ